MSQQNPALMHQNWGWTQTEILKSSKGPKQVYSCQASLCVPSNPGRQVLADIVTPPSLDFMEQFQQKDVCPRCMRNDCPYKRTGQSPTPTMLDNFYKFIFRR